MRQILRHKTAMFATLALTAPLLLAACQPSDTPPEATETPVTETSKTAETPSYSAVLKPLPGADGEVEAIAVTAELNGSLAEGENRLKLSAPIVYVMVDGIADRILDMTVTDQDGAIEFTTEDSPPAPGGFPYFRTWTATRDVTFPIAISYTSHVQPAGSRNGPAFGIRPSAGGVSGSGSGFLLSPANTTSQMNHLSWDLSAFDGDAIGVSTFGDGAADVPGAPSALMQGWYMAGPANAYPEDFAEHPFKGFWLGEFPYSVEDELEFTSHMYDYLGTHFTHLDPAPEYRVFLRQLDTPPFGGATALANSFMLSRGPAREAEFGQPGPRQTFTHEMLHQWVGGMNAPHGDITWFIEGLTTYYEYTLPFRAGEIDQAAYIDGLNHLSTIYYTNPGREMSADAIVAVGFNDGDIRHVPYQRGALYFADLDVRIREASNGTRSLDDLMKTVFAARENGSLDLTIETWAAEAAKETGADELAIVQRVHLDGELFLPSADGFGLCVEGAPATFTAEDGTEVDGISWVKSADMSGEDCFAVSAE
ncbi:M61 family metallopeptidase [Ponticaulis profundi]|uniref:Peptidase M61 catalytic domain-containing protein n=1 Tax=Ponticaulis profundi TaxID=2665222 RepID=A0ABW1S718_9PROT